MEVAQLKRIIQYYKINDVMPKLSTAMLESLPAYFDMALGELKVTKHLMSWFQT